MDIQSLPQISYARVISGTALIAGTAIGAGMLAIPLVTAQSGFFPAVATSVLVWLFMLATGLLFMEAALWMPKGANILTMSNALLGRKGKYAAGGMFLFLYYCLIVAYFAGGAPLLASLLGFESGMGSFVLFGALFATIVAIGAKAVDRVNLVLMLAMTAAYAALIGTGSAEVSLPLLMEANWSGFYVALPILFGAFGLSQHDPFDLQLPGQGPQEHQAIDYLRVGHANRVLVLNRGMLIAEGAPSAVRASAEVQAVYLGAGALYGAKP